MSAVDTIVNLSGLYVLTPEGEVGVYADGKTLVLDETLTRDLADYLKRLLANYLGDPHTGLYRLGVIYHARDQRPWGADTFALEECVVREVYAVSGQRERLTAFQKKNREKSVYRGFELLLEYRTESNPEAPLYCPILFDRSTRLDQYPDIEGSNTPGAPIPVLEVLNLVADIPVARRNTLAVATMMQNMVRAVVRKDMRDDRFTLAQAAGLGTPTADGPAEYFDADRRAERQVGFPPADWQQRMITVEQIQAGQRVNHVERWLRHPIELVDPARLGSFAQFKNLPLPVLTVLSQKSPMYTAPAGTRVLHRDMTDAWNMYLLEGSVSLEATDGKTLYITGGTDGATNPIAFLKPRKYTVTAMTNISFLWVHDALLGAVSSEARDSEP
jgi:hypothetical protein